MTAPPEQLREADFELIEAAVRETARGRWFLDEFARRMRAADAARILGAIDRLEARVAAVQTADEEARLNVERAVALLASLAEFVRAARGGGALEPQAQSPDAAALSAPKGEVEARLSALAMLDRLSVADKLKLFR